MRALTERLLGAFVTAVLATFMFVSAADAKPDVSKDLITPGTLLVGTDSPYRPFEFGKPPGYKGFDIDLVNAIAVELDLRVEILDTSFDTIFMDLNRGKFDLLASAATITPERKKVVSFTKPNFDATQSLVVRRGSGIRSVRDLAGKPIGVRDGTTGWWFARDRIPAAKVIGFRSIKAAIKALKVGRVDGLILDERVARRALENRFSGVRIAKSFSIGNLYGFATNKRDNKLRRGINWAFDRVKADGSFKRIYRKWFGINPPPSLRR